jgi:S1-C subfamily serine protease
VDAHGRLVGINTMINGPDVGVAIPVHVATAFLKHQLGDGDRPAPKTEPTPQGEMMYV